MNKASDGDTTQIAPGTYYEHDVNISKQLTVTGASAETTIVDGGQNGRVFVLLTHITLRHLTVQNGLSPDDPNLFVRSGGGVRVGTGAEVLIQHVIVRDNTASGSGGGIYHYSVPGGAITITHSLIADNVNIVQFGGGISTGRPLTIRNSIIRNNQTTSGGIYTYNAAAVLDLERVTITDNRSASATGMFVSTGVQAHLNNVTISDNVASNNYAGVQIAGAGAVVTVTNSTIAYNSRTNAAGVGWNGIAATSNGVAVVVNSIVAHNGERQCNTGDIISLGHNLSSDTYCDFTELGDLQNVNALLLQTLAPTVTLRPQIQSNPSILSSAVNFRAYYVAIR